MTASTHLVPFRSETLTLIEQDGEPFVAIKPICERLGIDPKSQRNKINADFGRWGGVIITLPSAGGAQETLCIPISKIFGWLATISPSKVAVEARDTLTSYQNECDSVLAAYFYGGKLKAFADLQRAHARLAAEYLFAQPMAARVKALQEAGLWRDEVKLRFPSRSVAAVYEFVSMMEDLGVIDPYAWRGEEMLLRAREAEAAARNATAPSAIDQTGGADHA